jgi:hypothetical protein
MDERHKGLVKEVIRALQIVIAALQRFAFTKPAENSGPVEEKKPDGSA